MGKKILVRNVVGHYKTPPQGSWLAYWEEKTGNKARECNDCSCNTTKDLIGGHVQKVPDDGSIYLTPICQDRNDYHKTDAYYVDEEKVIKVPAKDLELVEESNGDGLSPLSEWLRKVSGR